MKTVYLFISLLVSTISFGQNISIRLDAAIKKLQADEQFKHAIISMYVIDSKTGKPVFSHNSQLGLAPASCQKVVTSVAALELLGKDYRYKTEFGYDGIIEDTVLKGNILIKASGDPTLGSWRWNSTSEETIQQKITAVLKAKSVKVIGGDLVVDESKWETQATPRGWTWDDMGNYYGAGARALNWRENQYDMILKPGKKEGDSVAVVETVPELMVMQTVNELTTGKAGSGDNSIIYLPENGIVAYLRGTVPAGRETFTISGSIPKPLQVAKYRLLNYLYNNGIVPLNWMNPGSSLFDKKQPAPVFSNLMLTHYSPPLDSINYWFLQKSVNLFGEAFVKTIAYQKTGFGATDTGINIIKNFWQERGIEKSALNIIDGSGLSPANRVTADALVTVMQYAKKQAWYLSFYNALPEQNGIKMKSGYIGGVRSYTGYVRSKKGAEYTFSFIINSFDGSAGTVREKMWKLLDVLK